mmetsp:Transcript_43228/g.109164  ORF Transcript_43228/g.109164 Transcript_43228/m.109164 type:complete len:230 (+) Transcript_43228:65-754(+)|eukprot:CAMPEP_0177658690 /NCGR_PEP_ID=MMETSP0447-20121125/16975_1 /TAXON_ID=0 /ORGANISM="Stygamoeba regulata, Strain BSH-02190019" /LENGTH=229 /DNA_ID=CAMNT_0019163373 /DNA_START=87 /DNA_END=776 /DNA_ORIENTATION=+
MSDKADSGVTLSEVHIGARGSTSTGAVRVVCISDTHSHHRDLKLPPGDVLVHAGDFTRFGRLEHAEDFDEWLGEQPFEHRIIVAGNHEQKAEWFQRRGSTMGWTPRNGTLLRDSGCEAAGLTFYGCVFAWPVNFCCGPGSRYRAVPAGVDVLVVHGPAKGYVDHGCGCPDLRYEVARARPRLLVCGHIHGAHGMTQGVDEHADTCFVNAAMCRDGYTIGWEPFVATLEV